MILSCFLRGTFVFLLAGNSIILSSRVSACVRAPHDGWLADGQNCIVICSVSIKMGWLVGMLRVDGQSKQPVSSSRSAGSCEIVWVLLLTKQMIAVIA